MFRLTHAREDWSCSDPEHLLVHTTAKAACQVSALSIGVPALSIPFRKQTDNAKEQEVNQTQGKLKGNRNAFFGYIDDWCDKAT